MIAFALKNWFYRGREEHIKNDIRLLVNHYPAEEKYKVADQVIRSSGSVNALITEGHGRFTYPDQIFYCVQARGSVTETVKHLIDAFEDGYITAEQ